MLSSAAGSRNNEAYYQEREDRLQTVHKEEIVEMQERIKYLKHKSKMNLEEHREEIQFERKRRIEEVQRINEEHQAAIQMLKSEYIIALDKIKGLQMHEVASAKTAEESMK